MEDRRLWLVQEYVEGHDMKSLQAQVDTIGTVKKPWVYLTSLCGE